MTNALQPFITDLLHEKGYSHEENDTFAILQKDLTVRLEEFIILRTLKAFSENDLQSFQTLLDQKKSKAELQQFAMDHIPDFNTFLAGVLLEFEEVYLSSK